MFEIPALLSLSLDAIAVILYCQFPTIFGEVRNGQRSQEKSWDRFDLNPYHSSCILILLAGLRFLLFLPNIHQFQFQLPIIAWKRWIKLWHYFNGLAILTVALLICGEHGINPQTSTLLTGLFSRIQCILIAIGLLSLLCQSICVRHLSSSVLVPTINDYEWRLMPLPDAKITSEDDSNSMLSSLYYQQVAPACDSKSVNVTRTNATADDNTFSQNKFRMVSKASAKSSLLMHGPQSVDTLDLLVRLFASERVSDENNRTISASLQGQIDRTFRCGVPEVIFFIPQLVVFLYNSLSSHISSYLQDHLLQLCQTSINCAHRVYWFIRATFLANDHESDSSEMLLLLLSMVEDCGETIARKLSSTPKVGSHVNNSKEFSKSPIDNSIQLQHLYANSSYCSISKLVSEVDGASHNVDIHEKHSYPLFLAQTPPFLDKNYFQHNISFWDKMCDISRALSQIPRMNRTSELRCLLRDRCSDYLPSSCIYAPLNIVGSRHRIWSVIIDESFAFSTKNRAPIFLCLEIVEYDNDDNTDASAVLQSTVGKLDIFNRKTKTSGKVKPPPSEITTRHSTGSVVLSSSHLRSTRHVSFSPDSSVDTTLTSATSSQQPQCDHRNEPSCGNNLFSMPNIYGLSSWSDDDNSCQSFTEASDIGQWSPLHTRRPSNQRNSPSHEMTIVHLRQNSLSSTSVSTLENAMFEQKTDKLGSDDDNSQKSKSKITVLFKERWKEKELRLRQASPVGGCKGWKLLPVIIKTRDNLRQEQLIAQLIKLMHGIIQEASTNGPGCCWLYSYEIIALSGDSGMIEAIPDTVSIDALKKSGVGYASLKDFFDKFFVKYPDSYYEASEDEQSGHISLNLALDNYMKSLAGYSIICYLLQIKDRHNGNILLDIEGHIIHIDFGFVLGKTPGGNIGFENAPFKLTAEMVEVLEGFEGKLFQKFRDACVRTFMTLRRQHHRILLALEMIAQCCDDLPCFEGNPKATEDLRARFCADLHDNAAIEFVHNLVNESLDNWRTDCYDDYQRCCVGIF